MLNVHFKGVYFLTQKALPLLRDGGRIINISTVSARSSFAGFSAYVTGYSGSCVRWSLREKIGA